ncbi:MAG: hypothetical protein ACE5OZ_00380 [Candidatus Heimdallarchaeota archaeon]
MSGTVTIAKMVSLAHDQAIALPSDFLDSLRPKDDGSHAVMILAPSTKIIRIIPTKSPEVLKVAIEIGELSPDFLQELGVVFMRSKIKTLYSTGLCFTQDTCVYEGYIDVSDVNLPEDQLKSELSSIKGVSKVNIDLLKAS